MTILEQLFSKREQVHVLRFFLFHPDEDFTLAELRKKISKRSAVKPVFVNNLLRLNYILLGRREDSREIIYRMNTNWALFPEMRSLFVKSQLLVEHDLVRRLERAGKIK